MPSDNFDDLARSTLKKSTKPVSYSVGRVGGVDAVLTVLLAVQSLSFVSAWTGAVWFGVVLGAFSGCWSGGKEAAAGWLGVVRDV